MDELTRWLPGLLVVGCSAEVVATAEPDGLKCDFAQAESPSSCCACGDAGVGSPEELAATPRADLDAEWLALSIGGRVTAEQCSYDRIVRDLTAIRAVQPAAASYAPRPPDDGRGIILTTRADTRDAIAAGAYRAWDCLNAHYGVTEVRAFDIVDAALVELEGIYRLAQVGPEYARLPGITGWEPNMRFDGGFSGYTDICIDSAYETWDWTFVGVFGDCIASSCRLEHYRFSTTADGTATQLDAWTPESSSEAEPEWVARCT